MEQHYIYRIHKHRENKNYEGATIPMRVYLRKVEKSYMEEKRETVKNHLAQQPLSLLNNILLP